MYESFSCKIDVIDPHADSEELFQEYGFRLQENMTNDYDAIIVAVNHKEYINFSENDFQAMLKDRKGVFVDLKGIYKGKINNLTYWSL